MTARLGFLILFLLVSITNSASADSKIYKCQQYIYYYGMMQGCEEYLQRYLKSELFRKKFISAGCNSLMHEYTINRLYRNGYIIGANGNGIILIPIMHAYLHSKKSAKKIVQNKSSSQHVTAKEPNKQSSTKKSNIDFFKECAYKSMTNQNMSDTEDVTVQTNSKGIKIYCLRDGSICKKEAEVYKYYKAVASSSQKAMNTNHDITNCQ